MKLKPFDISKAKAGHPVCTRDGRDVRIICWDRKCIHGFNIVVLSKQDGFEIVDTYPENGQSSIEAYDLFLKPVKKTLWVNVYRCNDQRSMSNYQTGQIFDTEDQAKRVEGTHSDNYITTVPIEIEE